MNNIPFHRVWGTTLFEEIETVNFEPSTIANSWMVWGTTLFEEIETVLCKCHTLNLPIVCGELLCLKRSKLNKLGHSPRDLVSVGNYSV